MARLAESSDLPLARCVTTCPKRTAQEPPQKTLGACLFPGCCVTQAWPVDAAGGGEGRLLGISWVGVLRVVPFGQVELTAGHGPIAAKQETFNKIFVFHAVSTPL